MKTGLSPSLRYYNRRVATRYKRAEWSSEDVEQQTSKRPHHFLPGSLVLTPIEGFQIGNQKGGLSDS
ncbi:hypothetical protein TNCV_2999401 [Trichonephila clavipes]|nr:hypothetical protein TNCV_2999401 [Trichonephila clavipes]